MNEQDLQRIEALLDEDHVWNADDEADDRKLEAWEQATRALIAFAREHLTSAGDARISEGTTPPPRR